MNMKPILFNTDMVRAILADRKTVTRRVVKPRPEIEPIPTFGGNYRASMKRNLFVSPPYRPGDVMYVRETFCLFDDDHVVDGVKYAYKADATPESERVRQEYGYKWRPSIHMPREAARIFLRVTDVSVAKLQNITHEGIAKEGIVTIGSPGSPERVNPFFAFRNLWDTTIKPADRPLYGWDANPWVWVIEFERISREEAMKP